MSAYAPVSLTGDRLGTFLTITTKQLSNSIKQLAPEQKCTEHTWPWVELSDNYQSLCM